jgi:GST-like protein
MQLYGTKGWGSAIAEALLAMAGQAFEFVDVEGFEKPGPAQDRLAALNPIKQVPTLVLDDGTVMTETAAIALMLADRASGLAPAADDPSRARFLRLLVWLVANVYPTFTYGDFPERWTKAGAAELVESSNRYREDLWRWLETQVEGPFVLGERLSALDAYIAVMVAWRPRMDWFRANTPKLAAIADRVRALPAIAPVIERNGL